MTAVPKLMPGRRCDGVEAVVVQGVRTFFQLGASDRRQAVAAMTRDRCDSRRSRSAQSITMRGVRRARG